MRLKKQIRVIVFIFIFFIFIRDINASNLIDDEIKLTSDVPKLFWGQYYFDFTVDNNNISQSFQENDTINKFHKTANTKIRFDLNDDKIKEIEKNGLMIALNSPNIVQLRISKSNIDLDGIYTFNDKDESIIEIIKNTAIIKKPNLVNKKFIEFELEIWVSITDYEDFDILLDICELNLKPYTKQVCIAKTSSPITIKAQKSRYGLTGEYIKLNDVYITENFPGAFRTGEIHISFVQGGTINFEKINKNYLISSIGSVSIEDNKINRDDYIIIDILENNFTEDVSTIKIENINLKLCPRQFGSTFFSRSYVTGNSIFQNVNYYHIPGFKIKNKSPFFTGGGVSSDYLVDLYPFYYNAMNFFKIGENTYNIPIYNLKEYNVTDYKAVEFISKPYFSNNNELMFSVRDLGEILDADIEFDKDKKEVVLKKDKDSSSGEKEIRFKINDSKIKVNGIEQNIFNLDGELLNMETYNNYTYVPIKYVQNIFDIVFECDINNVFFIEEV